MDMDELLVKYLAGEANQDERSRAGLWIAASEENRKYFEHFKLIWEESQRLAYKSNVDEDAAWGRFRERLQKEYAEPPKPKPNFQWLKIAAILLVIIGAGFALIGPYFIKHSDSTRNVTPASSPGHPVAIVKSATADRIKTDTLFDGSMVTMNKYSSLNYPVAFNGRNRYVELSGEAFFNVKHDPARPFLIKVDGLLITVLGTSFNVKSRGDTTEVIVETGMVSVTRREQVIRLMAGEKLTALKTSSSFIKGPIADNLYRSYFDSKVAAQIKTAQSAAANAVKAKPDSTLDFKKHPDLLQKILKDPSKWSQILKNYRSMGEDLAFRRAVVKSVIAEINSEKLLGSDTVRSFRLNDGELIINDKRQPEAVHQRFKDKFIKEPGYVIYFGGAPKNGRGVFLPTDSL